MTEKRFEDDFVERSFAAIKAANKPTVNIESVRRVDGSEAVSIDAWLHRIGNGYEEYAPVKAPPQQVGRIDRGAFAEALVRHATGRSTPEELEAIRAAQEADRVKQLEKAQRARQREEAQSEEFENTPHDRWQSKAAKLTDAEFNSARIVMAEIKRGKRMWEKYRESVEINQEVCGQVLVTGVCVRCGKTITSGIGWRSSHGTVLCGYCSDLNMPFEGQPTLRSQFPKDISPDTPGDGRIVRKSTYDKDLEVRWWTHRKNPRPRARGF
jgi:hypothetical protein